MPGRWLPVSGCKPLRVYISRRILVVNDMGSFSTSRFASFLLSDNTEAPAVPRSAGDVSDEEMLAKISAGDREVLALLLRRHAPTVLAIGRRICVTRPRRKTSYSAFASLVFAQASVQQSIVANLHQVSGKVARDFGIRCLAPARVRVRRKTASAARPGLRDTW